MEILKLLADEQKGAIDFFLDFTNLAVDSRGFGLTVDSTKQPQVASIAAVGFALTGWVIACERGYLPRRRCLEIARGTLKTLCQHASQYRGFFAHFLHMETGERFRKCEYSTIDTALCLNGVITAAAYFGDAEIDQYAEELLERVDWEFIVFDRAGQTLFHMAYNPDVDGDYVTAEPGFISQWDMAAEQKMMYLQAAPRLEPASARNLYRGFRRDTGRYQDQEVILIPGGSLFAYLFSEAWLDVAKYRDPDGVDWFTNTRLAALANRDFCIRNTRHYPTYHSRSWGLSAGDSPKGYAVFGSEPCLGKPHHDGTVSIYAALACLPFIPEEVMDMVAYLRSEHPQTWGRYGFFDAYNLASPSAWYSQAIYGIDKGCSLIMMENYLSGLIWDIYTNSPTMQKALKILGFQPLGGGSCVP